MLSFDQVDDLLQPLSDYFERFNQSVIEDMARRLTRMFNGQKSGLNSTLWQLNRLRESGALYDDILSRLGELTPYTEQELQRIFEQAGLKSIEHEHAIIKDLGRSVVSLEQSPAMINVLRASLIKTKGVLYNLTQTMPMAGQDQFIEVSDLAYEQVARGT
ncbi:MAG: phage minor capsid protein, partial [Anaerolineaceae bacterium]